jgi:hypothetical protein
MQLDQNLITNHTKDWLMNTDRVKPCMIHEESLRHPNRFLLRCCNSAGFIHTGMLLV